MDTEKMKNFYQKNIIVLILIALFTIISLAAFGNETVKTWKKKAIQDTVVTITPQGSRVFYRGLRNWVQISVKGVKLSEITVTAENGRITKGKDGLYDISPLKYGNTKIIVSVKGKVIHQKVFRAKLVPSPRACINGLEGKYSATKSQILEGGGLVVSMPGFDNLYKITEFSLSTNIGGFSQSAESKGEKFTPKQIQIINYAKKGGKIYFEDLHATGSDGRDIKLATFTITIK